MTYVAFLRGVNVGGKGIVSMAAIKEALVALGLSDVRTYINSGNVIFSTRASDAQRLTAWIEKALEQHTGTTIAGSSTVSRSSPASMSSSTRLGLSSGASIARTWAGAR